MNTINASFDSHIAWYNQYGKPKQACFYPDVKKTRARVIRSLIAKGYQLANSSESSHTRPKGYDTDSGYMYFWGLGGDFPKPNLPK
jgi:hypothetical protein